MVELLNAISDALAGAGTPLGFAALMFFATIGLGVFLNGDQRTYLGLWLSGEFSRGEWARSFNAFFDTVFGANPLSLRFLAASAAVSLLATWAIWELLGGLGVLGGRMQALPIASVLLAALLVNVAADYVSLIETRWLLRRLEGWTSTWAQAAGLAADALFTAAIILIALAAYDALLPLLPAGLTPEGAEAGSFRPSEIVGAFSFYTVLFYSTFATSVWSWLFVLSAALLRGLGRLRPERWTVVNERPVLILATVVFGVAWIGAQGAGAVLARGADGVSLADRGLCRVFRDEICLRLGDLTENEQARLDLLLDACAGGVTTECLWRGVPTWEGTPEEAARLFAADCAGGNAGGCTNLGVLHQQGRGMDQDFAEAARLYRQGCDGGDARGCSNLGVLHHQGLGMDPDLAEAAR
ncbi:MAG: tetratricopeptide repeat protein, partial [Pseudomonadota bacterium]